MLQRTKFKIIAYTAVLVIAIAFLAWWISFNSARSRDYQRLADLKIIQAEFLNYYSHFNTFQVPECQANTLINFCQGKGEQKLSVNKIIDPVGNNYYQYVIGQLSENDFNIHFSFETEIAGLPVGNYVLTKKGIKK